MADSYGGGHIIERNGTVSVDNPQLPRAEVARKMIEWISPKSVLSYTESDTLNVFRSGVSGVHAVLEQRTARINENYAGRKCGIALFRRAGGRAKHSAVFVGSFAYSSHPARLRIWFGI